MSRLVAVILLLGASLALDAATYTTYTWQAVDGNYNGSFADSDHWTPSQSFYPGYISDAVTNSNQLAVFPRVENTLVRVTFPDGEVNNISSFQSRIGTGQSTWFIGTNTIWNMPALTDGVSKRKNFSFYADGGSSDTARRFIKYESEDAVDRGYFKNFLVCHSSTASGTRLDVYEGELNFTPSDGMMMLFDDTAGGDIHGLAELCMHEGTSLSLPMGAYIGSSSKTNRLTFAGGTHTLGNMRTQFNVGNSAGFSEIDIAVTNGASVYMENLSLGYANVASKKFSNEKVHRVTVADGAKLTFNKFFFDYPGLLVIDALGADSTVTATSDFCAGNYSNSVVRIAVVDGATLSLSYRPYFGARSVEMAVGNDVQIALTNATLNLAGNHSLTMYSGRLSIVDTDVFVGGAQGAICGGGVAGLSPECEMNGVTMTLTTTKQEGPISGFATVALGSRGLTFYSKHALQEYTVSQNFSNMIGEAGELRFSSSYPSNPYTLMGDNSTESRLVVENGTVNLGAGANHYSHLVVMGGATFSIKNNAAAATLRGLTLEGSSAGHATFELDTTDTVRIEGPIAFYNGVFNYSSTLAVGTHTVFTSTQATQAEKDGWLLGSGFSINGIPEGSHIMYKTVENGGETAFQIIISSSLPSLSGENGWRGEGSSAAWNDAGNWNGVVPSATERAVFDGSTPKSVTISGAADAAAVRFSEGGYTLDGGTLSLTRTSDDGAAIEVLNGSAEVGSGVQLTEYTGARAEVYVAPDTTLEISGRVLGGGIDKTGDGKLILENDANLMPQGFAVHGGILSVSDPLALGGGAVGSVSSVVADGTLEITGNASGGIPGGKVCFESSVSPSNGVVVDAKVDASLRLAGASGASLFKRGAGELSLLAASDITVDFASALSMSLTKDHDVSFPTDGEAPDSPRGSINVVEGALALRSEQGKPTLTMSGKAANGNARQRVYVGYPSSSVSVTPSFKVDGVVLSARGQEFVLGSFLTSENYSAADPTICITNGGQILAWTFSASDSTTLPGLRPIVSATDGVLDISGITMNACNSYSVTNRYVFSDNSRLAISQGQNVIKGPVEVEFNNSRYEVYYVNANADSVRNVTFQMSGTAGRRIAKLDFCNGSYFMCAGFVGNSASANIAAPVELSFSSSEWFAGDSDVTLPATRVDVTTTVTGDGLRLAPAAGVTWTWAGSVVGSGDIVKDGDGTVRFVKRISAGSSTDDPTMKFTGVTDIRAGTLAVAQGAAELAGRVFKVAGTLDFEGASVSGFVVEAAGGTVRNANCEGFTIAVTDGFSPVTLDAENGFEMSRRTLVDFAEAAESLKAKGESFVVARWTGSTPPNVTRWRSSNVSSDCKATFRADGEGNIVAEIVSKGGTVVVLR